MEEKPSGWDPWAPLPVRPPWLSPPLPDGGEAARVALKHAGIVEHGPSGVAPSSTPLFRSDLSPNSSGHRISQHPSERRMWTSGAASAPRMPNKRTDKRWVDKRLGG